MRRSSRRLCWSRLAAFLVLAAGCDDGPMEVPMVDAGPTFGIASTAQINDWEGQTRLVTVLSSETGESLEGAVVEPQDPDGALEVIEQRCAGTRCAVVLAVSDATPNTGTAVPSPIDAESAFLIVRRTTGPDLRALLNVLPLDTIDGGSSVRTSGVRYASRLEGNAATVFGGEAAGAPIRWVVFGDATLAGAIDVSAEGAAPGPGGDPGGAAGLAAPGSRGGGAGLLGAGAGGGGHRTAGVAGDGAGGEPLTGGAGGAAGGMLECGADFFETAPCGGGAGGGATGPGGGGGAMALVVLGRLDLSSASLRARGGDADGGGGGGAGGAILVAASEWSPPSALDASGGLGEGAGGAGGEGALRVEIPGRSVAGESGAAVDLGALPAITDLDRLTLRGSAAPDAVVIVERADDGARVTTTADSEGGFSVEVALEAGLNRFRILDVDGAGQERRSWVGTSIELERRDAVRPTGALVDIARVP